MNNKKIKVSKRALEKFNYFAQCQDTKRLPEILFDVNGYTAVECFHVHESEGKQLPCNEPVLLSRALNGKEWHGLTVTNCAEDFISGLFFKSDLVKYPDWVKQDIIGRATQLALVKIGFVPTFLRV